jgi:hypothetical protein
MFPGGTCVGVLYPLIHDVASMSDLLWDLDPCTFKVQGVLGIWISLGVLASWYFEESWEVDI